MLATELSRNTTRYQWSPVDFGAPGWRRATVLLGHEGMRGSINLGNRNVAQMAQEAGTVAGAGLDPTTCGG